MKTPAILLYLTFAINAHSISGQSEQARNQNVGGAANVGTLSRTSLSPKIAKASSGKTMLESVNEYREAAGLGLLTWSETLQANAAKTGAATNGKSMRHMMNPGTGSQVLAMGTNEEGKCTRDFGDYTAFEIYFYSWLCEVPDGPGLNGICPEILRMSRVDSMGQTGHYKILSARASKSIGCAFTRNPSANKCSAKTSWNGIWACDLR